MKGFNGKNQRAPPALHLPDSHGSNLRQQWLIGSELLSTLPLHVLEHDDVDFLVHGVRALSDAQAFMKMTSDEAKRLSLHTGEPSPEECLPACSACCNVFLTLMTTKKG